MTYRHQADIHGKIEDMQKDLSRVKKAGIGFATLIKDDILPEITKIYTVLDKQAESIERLNTQVVIAWGLLIFYVLVDIGIAISRYVWL